MATNLRPITQTDFSGGMNAVVSPFLISQRQVAEAINLVLDEHGALRTRDGYQVLTTSPDTVNALLLRGLLVKSSGQEFPFAVQAFAGGGGSPIVADVVTTGTFASVSSKTLSMTLGASATLLIATIHFQTDTRTVTGVTFDGTPLTKIGHVVGPGASGNRTELWALLSPTTGSTKNLIASFSGSSDGGLVSGRSFTVATGWGTAVTATGTSSAPSVSVSSATNDMVIDAITAENDAQAMTPGAGQTEQYDADAGADRAAGSREDGAASVTMSWTLGSSQGWGQIAVNLLSGTTGNTIYKTDDDPWTSVGSLSTELVPDSVNMIDKVIFIHGYATPKSWDGTTLTNITAANGQTVPPGAKHGIFHLGALWVYNTDDVTTTLDGSSSLRASDANDPNSWPNANQTFISRDDGQVGMGLVAFTIVETGISPTATLIGFKNYSTYQVTGVFGASNFSVQPIKSDMGCIAARTIQFVSGFGVIRLTHKGFALYNGVEDRLISEEIRPTIFGGKGYTALNFTAVDQAWARQSQNPPLYIAACPVEGTALTRLFIYDLVRRGWTLMTLPVALSTLSLFLSPTTSPVVHAGTATGGQIIQLFNGDMDDDGDPISWSVTTKRYFSQNQMQLAFWRRAVVDVEAQPNTQVTVTPYLDAGARGEQTFLLPDGITDTTRTVFSPDLVESAHDVQLVIEGSNNVHIRGIEFHASAKPLTRFLSRQ